MPGSAARAPPRASRSTWRPCTWGSETPPCKPRTEISACLRHRGAGADRSSGPEDSHLDPRQERATLTSQCPRVEGDVMAGRSTGLKRQLSLVSLVALAAGAVLGGWLAEAPYWF